MISQRLDVRSAQSYATAERDLWFPTISAAGVTGLVPYRQDPLPSRYAAAGFNVNVPIFNGRLFNAVHTEATARAPRAAAISARPSGPHRPGRPHGLAECQFRLPASFADRAAADQTTQAFDLAQARYNWA